MNVMDEMNSIKERQAAQTAEIKKKLEVAIGQAIETRAQEIADERTLTTIVTNAVVSMAVYVCLVSLTFKLVVWCWS
jgi:hypothetical protein